MNYTRFLLLTVFTCASMSAISIVYNFRIAQITKQPIVEGQSSNDNTIIGLLFDQYQQKYTGCVAQNFAGGLGSYIYDFKPYYFRTDFAVSHIHETTAHVTTFAGTETDDILFTLGRNFTISKTTTVTLSGLFGIPTHRIFRLQHVDFGYSQVGAGAQFDGTYALQHDNALLYGARYIYFVPRNARDDAGCNYRFTIGNIGDLLFAYKQNWHQHGLEGGYTFRSQFRARICPSLDDTVQRTDYLRSNFYLVYKYKFLIRDVANRFLFNISYGFDHKPKTFGNKFIVTVWAAWDVRF